MSTTRERYAELRWRCAQAARESDAFTRYLERALLAPLLPALGTEASSAAVPALLAAAPQPATAGGVAVPAVCRRAEVGEGRAAAAATATTATTAAAEAQQQQQQQQQQQLLDVAALRDVAQGSAAWFAARKGRLTASRFGAAAGLSRYATPRSLWQLMSGVLEGGPDDSSSDATRHGQRTEPEARGVYALVRGCGVVESGFWVHREHAWLGASPDGLVGAEGLLEIKCPVHQLHAAVPREYMAQVQGQLEVLGRAWCDFVSWRQGRLLIVRVRRSAAYWAWLFGRLQRFWRGVGSGVDPQLEAIALEGGEQPPPVPQEVLYQGAFDVNDYFG